MLSYFIDFIRQLIILHSIAVILLPGLHNYKFGLGSLTKIKNNWRLQLKLYFTKILNNGNKILILRMYF